MMLEWSDINLNQADGYLRRPPVSWATENGYVEVVKLLYTRTK